MKFKAKGTISAKNGKNTVEVEGVKYWISGIDMLRIAEFCQLPKGQPFRLIPEIEGVEVFVEIIKDELGCWAQLTEQPTWCPLPYC